MTHNSIGNNFFINFFSKTFIIMLTLSVSHPFRHSPQSHDLGIPRSSICFFRFIGFGFLIGFIDLFGFIGFGFLISFICLFGFMAAKAYGCGLMTLAALP